MDVSVVSGWVTIVMAILACLGFLWRTFQWIQNRQKETNEAARKGQEIANLLVTEATNSARRDDVYLLVMMRLMQFNTRHTVFSSQAQILGLIVLAFVMLIGPYADRVLPSADVYKLTALRILVVAMVVAYAGVIWSGARIRKMELSWQRGVRQALDDKLAKHFQK